MDYSTLRIGGVPEHFNLPWHLALEEGIFEKENISLQWQDYPGGTGAMASDLGDKKLDLALLLTEGAVADICKGGNYKIISLYVESPLIWGIHVYHTAPFQHLKELEGKRFGISRFGSGSHLMAFVNARQQGWDPSRISFEVVGNMEGAQQALAAGKADAFMWEKFMTKPLVDQGDWKRMGECPTPWPCFVMVARNEIISNQVETLRRILRIIRAYCLKAKQTANTIPLVARRYGLKEEDAATWFKEVEWAQENNIQHPMLERVMNMLLELQIIEKKLPPEALCHSI